MGGGSGSEGREEKWAWLPEVRAGLLADYYYHYYTQVPRHASI